MGLIPKTGKQQLKENKNKNHKNKTKNANNLNNTIDYLKKKTIP